MTGRSAPLAVAMALLVLSIVVAIGLIPFLEAELRRAMARRAAAEAVSRKPEQVQP
ncbi:hypothetical protein [Methylobacterium brachiatum]|uniref:hypothetical protein n=1 Tax=Methylobacterium brachiatum TaxID=269660 RepID=UPI002448B8D0|nr:hypothetical protein [Methylobacterium brachiatum]MDH2313086.1 hypothetical protein [Methylobacterium brachiatum]